MACDDRAAKGNGGDNGGYACRHKCCGALGDAAS